MGRTMRFIILSAAMGTLVAAFTNCGSSFRSVKPYGSAGSSTLQGTSTGNPGNQLTFDKVAAQVFVPHCVECHNSVRADDGVDYSSYSAALNTGKLDLLYRSYADHIEPDEECTTISNEKMDLVAEWLGAGAPQ